MKYLRLVWSNLKRKKVRTALTLLCILVAFVLFGYLAAIRQAFNAGVDVAGADRLVVRHKVAIIQLLPESYKTRMENIEGIAVASHATWFDGRNPAHPRTFFASMPVEPERFLTVYPEYLLDDEERQGWLSTRTGAIVGKKIAKRFGWQVGDRITLQSSIWRQKEGDRTWEFDISGIYEGVEKGTDNTQLFFRFDYFSEARANGDGMVGWYTVKIDNPEEAEAVAARIDEEFANSSAETKSEPEGAFIQAFANQAGNIGVILMAVLTAVFFTILLVSGNTMAQTVRERTGELAVLKAMGFTHQGVLGLVLAESCLLSVVGGVLGLGVAWLLISAGDPTNGSLPVFFFPVRDMVVGVVLIFVLGLAAGFPPAWQAMRLQVAEGLRR